MQIQAATFVKNRQLDAMKLIFLSFKFKGPGNVSKHRASLRHANTMEQIVPKPHHMGLSASQILEI
jgi:hypothetical protein